MKLKWIAKTTWDGSCGDFCEEEEGGRGCEVNGTVSGAFSAIVVWLIKLLDWNFRNLISRMRNFEIF